MCVWVPVVGKRGLELMELAFQVVVRHPVWVNGKLWFSARAVNAFNCWASSPVLQITFIKSSVDGDGNSLLNHSSGR